MTLGFEVNSDVFGGEIATTDVTYGVGLHEINLVAAGKPYYEDSAGTLKYEGTNIFVGDHLGKSYRVKEDGSYYVVDLTQNYRVTSFTESVVFNVNEWLSLGLNYTQIKDNFDNKYQGLGYQIKIRESFSRDSKVGLVFTIESLNSFKPQILKAGLFYKLGTNSRSNNRRGR